MGRYFSSIIEKDHSESWHKYFMRIIGEYTAKDMNEAEQKIFCIPLMGGRNLHGVFISKRLNGEEEINAGIMIEPGMDLILVTPDFSITKREDAGLRSDKSATETSQQAKFAIGTLLSIILEGSGVNLDPDGDVIDKMRLDTFGLRSKEISIAEIEAQHQRAVLLTQAEKRLTTESEGLGL